MAKNIIIVVLGIVILIMAIALSALSDRVCRLTLDNGTKDKALGVMAPNLFYSDQLNEILIGQLNGKQERLNACASNCLYLETRNQALESHCGTLQKELAAWKIKHNRVSEKLEIQSLALTDFQISFFEFVDAYHKLTPQMGVECDSLHRQLDVLIAWNQKQF